MKNKTQMKKKLYEENQKWRRTANEENFSEEKNTNED